MHFCDLHAYAAAYAFTRFIDYIIMPVYNFKGRRFPVYLHPLPQIHQQMCAACTPSFCGSHSAAEKGFMRCLPFIHFIKGLNIMGIVCACGICKACKFFLINLSHPAVKRLLLPVTASPLRNCRMPSAAFLPSAKERTASFKPLRISPPAKIPGISVSSVSLLTLSPPWTGLILSHSMSL